MCVCLRACVHTCVRVCECVVSRYVTVDARNVRVCTHICMVIDWLNIGTKRALVMRVWVFLWTLQRSLGCNEFFLLWHKRLTRPGLHVLPPSVSVGGGGGGGEGRGSMAAVTMGAAPGRPGEATLTTRRRSDRGVKLFRARGTRHLDGLSHDSDCMSLKGVHLGGRGSGVDSMPTDTSDSWLVACLLACLLNILATLACISWTDLLRQVYVLPPPRWPRG